MSVHLASAMSEAYRLPKPILCLIRAWLEARVNSSPGTVTGLYDKWQAELRTHYDDDRRCDAYTAAMWAGVTWEWPEEMLADTTWWHYIGRAE